MMKFELEKDVTFDSNEKIQGYSPVWRHFQHPVTLFPLLLHMFSNLYPANVSEFTCTIYRRSENEYILHSRGIEHIHVYTVHLNM